MSDRNHEGYHDPTASEAIRRADRSHWENTGSKHLTHELREVIGFHIAQAALKNQQY